jgi:hypothetical protein
MSKEPRRGNEPDDTPTEKLSSEERVVRSPNPTDDEQETVTKARPAENFSTGKFLADRFRIVRFMARGGMGEL